MAIAAAEEVACYQQEKGLDAEHIIPTIDDREVFARQAAVLGVKAQEQGVARLKLSRGELLGRSEQTIRQAQDMTHFLMDRGLIPPVPA